MSRNNSFLNHYLKVDKDAYYFVDGKRKWQSVHGKSYTRKNKAIEQSKKQIIKTDIIEIYVLEFLKKIGISTTEKPCYDPLQIDYDEIKRKYSLNNEKDIVWMKFTKDGFLGVVADSNDVNFEIPATSDDYDKKDGNGDWLFNSAGILVHSLNKEWNKSFVLLFPLANIPNGYTRHDIEMAVGNYLIEMGVPILDYYSHMI